jgi:hypothetical protein
MMMSSRQAEGGKVENSLSSTHPATVELKAEGKFLRNSRDYFHCYSERASQAHISGSLIYLSSSSRLLIILS